MFSYIFRSAHLLVKNTVCNRFTNCISSMQCVYVCGISPSKILRGLLVIRIKLDAKEIFITPIITLTAYTYVRFVKSRKVSLQAAERLGEGEAQVSTCIQRVSETLVKLSHEDPEGDVRLALK